MRHAVYERTLLVKLFSVRLFVNARVKAAVVAVCKPCNRHYCPNWSVARSFRRPATWVGGAVQNAGELQASPLVDEHPLKAVL